MSEIELSSKLPLRKLLFAALSTPQSVLLVYR